ncbi:hypothetical protein ACOME3_007456 [Neoechinorhynchus agilis]
MTTRKMSRKLSESSFTDHSNKKRSKQSLESPMSVVSWNVNGLRAWATKKTTIEWIVRQSNADIVCLQETKFNSEKKSLRDHLQQNTPELLTLYPFIYSLESQTKKGYSGIAILKMNNMSNLLHVYFIGKQIKAA